MAHYNHRGERIELRASSSLTATWFRSQSDRISSTSELKKIARHPQSVVEIPSENLVLHVRDDLGIEALDVPSASNGLTREVLETPRGALLISKQEVYADFEGWRRHDLERLLNRSGGSVMEEPTELFPFHILHPNDENPFRLADELTHQAGVSASPGFVRLIPRGPFTGLRGITLADAEGRDLSHLQWGLSAIHALEARQFTAEDPDVIVAVLDSGVDLAHPDLVDLLRPGYNFVDSNHNAQPPKWDFHGTACAGIVIADHNNGEGMIGVASGCRCLPVRIGTNFDLGGEVFFLIEDKADIEGIRYAIGQGARVISISLGAPEGHDGLEKVIRQAVGEDQPHAGCVVVAAAGNDDSDVDYPARYEETIAVAATLPGGQRWPMSNHGAEISLAAPGVDIVTTDIAGIHGVSKHSDSPIGSDYIRNFGGTSAACAFVAGVAALVLAEKPELSARHVRTILEESASGGGAHDGFIGYGLVNALKAVQMARNV